jgi:regulator of nucleoside diphosphate kinase
MKKKIILNQLDHTRIKNAIQQARQYKSIHASDAENLLKELAAAQIVAPKDVPENVVTMNSVVKVSFLDTGKQLEFQIVYPAKANIKDKKISIFSPIATALLGYRVSDEIEWLVPAGPTKIRIDEILYQPEASGDYDL